MPASHPSNWPPLQRYLKKLSPEGNLPNTVLDLGCGKGNIGTRIRSLYPQIVVDGVEVFPKNVEKALSRSLDDGSPVYRNVYQGDIRNLFEGHIYDLYIAYDVLEHISRADALRIMKLCAGKMVVSVPLGVYEQGPVGGNVHETHVDTWTHDEMMEIAGECLFKGKILGVYLV